MFLRVQDSEILTNVQTEVFVNRMERFKHCYTCNYIQIFVSDKLRTSMMVITQYLYH